MPMPGMGAPSAPPPAAGGMDDLLGLLGGDAPAPAPAPAPGGMDAMAGMMGGMSMGGGGGPAPIQAFSKNGLTILFACKKDPNNASVTIVDASFSNAQGAPMTGFAFQVAVPKYMKLQMSPASSDTLPPMSNGAVTQQFKLANSMQ